MAIAIGHGRAVKRKTLCMPDIIAKQSTVTVNKEDGFFVDRLDLAIDSTCPVSMMRQRKLQRQTSQQ